MTDDQLPAIIPSRALTIPSDTYTVPALIAHAGDAAGWRYVDSSPPTFAIRTRGAPIRAAAGDSSIGASAAD
ncbi:MAG: hypothetical protein JO264_07840 [Acidisphaera sp.]|nr:hypothetical protein [Acidisphaera sp.]